MEDRHDEDDDHAPPPPLPHTEEEGMINDNIIDEIINDADNLMHHDTDNAPILGSPASSFSITDNDHQSNHASSSPRLRHVSRAYRKLLVHESKRLKAENGRLLRKVEKMRCIRSSMQNIFDQLQENEHEHHLQNIEHERKDQKIEQEEEEEELEIEHLNDLQQMERIRHNAHKQMLLKKKQREERKKLRQQRLLRFAKSRAHQQQLHYNNTIEIQNANANITSFIPRVCSTPACNHPVRPGGRSVCCRGCLKKQHTATCHQRALKSIERRRNTHNNEYMPPELVRGSRHPHHHNKHRHNNNHHHTSTFDMLHDNDTHHTHTRRARSHSSSNVLGTSHKAVPPRNRRRHSMKCLFCDKCRCRFTCVSDLERHKIIHHSPVVAARMHSHSPTRNPGMPPPIPELTASFHTTMPNQTKNKFRYKKSDQTLPTPPNDTHDMNEMDRNADAHAMDTNRHNKLSRLGLLGRRIRGGNTRNMMDNEQDTSAVHQRKRKHSLSQLFSTFLPNARRHHEDHHNTPNEDGMDLNDNDTKEEKEEKEEDEAMAHTPRNHNKRDKRRSLSSLLYAKRVRHRNNHNHNASIASPELHTLSDEDIEAERVKIKALRRKLELRKQALRQQAHASDEHEDEEPSLPNPENKEEEKMSTPSNVSTLWDELAAINPDIVSCTDYIHNNDNDSDHRPRHRRCNAMNIMPFITNSDNDEHDEEEKSMQPIARRTPNTAPYTESDIVALRRKARERKLRRTHAMFQVQPQHHHSNNHNPFRQHRSFRTSSLNASNMACLHHSHRRASTNSISPHHRYKRGSTSGMHTYRNQVRTHRTHHGHHNNNNTHSHRPRLRQPFIPTVDSTTERRNRAPGSAPRNRPPRRRGAFLPHRASHHEDNASTNQRSEEIARLLQQRDSLLQHFNDTISRSGNGHAHSSSFDINALRQRNVPSGAFTLAGNNGNNTRHGRSHSTIVTALNSRVDLTYLPIRCVQASDLGKGNESSSNCSICQEKFKIGDKVKTLPCFHFFHVEEIDRWLTGSRACPVCRHSIDHVNFK
eukprot:156886_1